MKYYTPTIEEFHVGFEYYHASFINQELSLYKVDDTYDFKAIAEEIDKEIVRVKHLDREDIESLGWVKNQNSEKFCFNGRYFLFFNNDKLVISDLDTIGNIIRFQGIIKNKSELRKLMNQLNIE